MNEKGFRTGLVSRLVGLSYKRIDYYDRQGIVQPDIQKASGRGSRRLYSRANLVELLVLRRLMDHRISLEKVRRALAEARSRYPKIIHPLQELTLRTDGITIYMDDPDAGGPTDLLNPQQPLIGIALEAVTEQIDKAITEFEDHRIEEVRADGKTYLIEVVNDTESHGYITRCPELLGVSVKGQTLEILLGEMKARIEETLIKLQPRQKKKSK